MNTFNYETTLPKLMTPDIMHRMSFIHECKGRQDLYQKMQGATIL